MNVFRNTKTGKKLILVMVLLILFNFCYPKKVNAGLIDDVKNAIISAPCRIFFWMEEGVLNLLNDIFCDDEHASDTGTLWFSPETIIKGRFALFEANIFKDIKSGDKNYYDSGSDNIINGRITLRKTVAGWYYALRNFSIVALLSVLVYIGIRMTISTVSQDKAKYKSMLKDWFVALCLLFAMHYIMLGVLNLSSMIVEAIGTSGHQVNMAEKSQIIIQNVLDSDEEDMSWEDKNKEAANVVKTYNLGSAYAQTIVLLAIIIYTIIFAIKYIKRMIMIMFLSLIAPISCVTYPIDKVADGKAQAYNRWFQEFFYNVIIQPFHLLIYIVLVGSAVDLANENVLYAIMCFAVMIPAEKFIKEMFGFKDKLGSPLGAFAGGALASKAMNALTGKAKGAITGGKGENDSTPNDLPPRTVNKDGLVDGKGGDGATPENPGLEAAEGGAIAAGAANGLNQGQDGETDRVEDTLQTQQDNEALAEGENAINNSQGAEEDDDYQKAFENYENGKYIGAIGESTGFKGWVQKSGKAVYGKGQKALAIHDQRMAKKYGTTSRAKRWVKRAGK